MLTTPGQACGIGGDPVNFRRDQPQTDPSHHISRIVAALPPPPGAELGRKINGGLPRERRIGRTKAFPLWTMAIGTRQKRSEEHTSELQSLMRISYAVFCLKKKKTT